jgi:hypothetical protein
MLDRDSMVDFIVRNASGNTPELNVRNYYASVNLGVVESDYQRLLQHERLRITNADPETVKAEQRAQAAIQEADRARQQLRWMQICNTVVNGRVITDCAANKSEVTSWFDPVRDTKGVSSEWFRDILAQQPQLARRLAWTDYQSPAEQQQHKQETDEQTKAVLLDTCRRFNLSYSDANIASTLQFFPEGCDSFQLQSAIQSGQLHLHGASWNEIEEHTSALLRAHAIKWHAKSISELKAQSGIEREEREAILNRVTPEPSRPVGVVPLPPEITKEKILAALNNRDRDTIHNWKIRYGGMDAINARLQGLA